jgi:SNF2 family DNA or RNA helicase
LFGLAGRAYGLDEGAKPGHLIGILNDFPDKMVVFTQFRATQDAIHRTLKSAGERVEIFHGSMSRLEKEESVKRFQHDARILVCTESGSEGRNLQFCNAICNYDLPWNPMRIEQRIGRLSRIGQTRDVHIFNLVASDTIEDAILYLLEAKINMFELVIGEIDMIIGNLDSEKEFDDMVMDIWIDSEDDSDFKTRMDCLGEELLAAREQYIWQREYDDKLFGDKFVSKG